jgi:hypothetical protein
VVHACFQNFKSTLDSNNRVLTFELNQHGNMYAT